MIAAVEIRQHAAAIVVLIAVLLAGLLYYPGTYFLTSDTQIYAVMMEHQLHPETLKEDLLSQHPHLAFTLYDEMVNWIHVTSGFSRELVMRAFQVFFRTLMLLAAYVLSYSVCRSRLIACWAAASLQIVSLVAGPVVCVFEWEPVPRGFSLTLAFLAVSLMVAGRRWAAAWAIAAAMFFQAGVTYPFLACFAGWLVFARGEEPLFRRLRLLLPTALAVALAVIIGTARSDGPSGLFEIVEPWHLEVIRTRASYNLVSTWPTLLIVQSLVAPVVIALSFLRLRDVLPKHLGWFLVGIPVIALISVPASWIAMEKLRLLATAQLQPARAMAFSYAMAVVMLLSAGVLAARKHRWLESAFWICCGYMVVFLDQVTATVLSLPLFPELRVRGFWAIGIGLAAAFAIRWYERFPARAAVALLVVMALPFAVYREVFDINYMAQDARTPEVLALSEWAAQESSQDAVFHFAGFRKGYQPGVFRATAERAVYVDWKAGGQVNFNSALAAIWWDRWQKTGAGRFDPKQIPYLTSLDLDYLVIPPGAAISGVEPVYRNSEYLTYRMEDLADRATRGGTP